MIIDQAPATPRQKVRVISCAWGDLYVSDFCKYCLPALLAPGNLPALSAEFDVELVFLTKEEQFDSISLEPAWQAANRVCAARLVAIDDLLVGPSSYGMSLTQALYRGFADQGPAMTKNWQLFLNSDFILADGSMRRLAERMKAGSRLILSPSYCVNAEAAKPILDRARDLVTQAMTITPRSMAEIILRNRHATIRGKTINQQLFSFLYSDQFYWLVDNYTILGRQIPIAMVAMMPKNYLSAPTTYWDYGVTADFVPDTEATVLGDSDDFLMLELRANTTAHEALRLGARTINEMAASLQNFATKQTIQVARQMLILHSRDIPEKAKRAQKKLSNFVDRIIGLAGTLPSGDKHFQWQHHIDALHAFQRSFWSNRARALTMVGKTVDPAIDLRPSVRLFPLDTSAPGTPLAILRAAPCDNENSGEKAIVAALLADPENAKLRPAIDRFLDSISLVTPLTEVDAAEISRRFMTLVDHIIECWLNRHLEHFRATARKEVARLQSSTLKDTNNSDQELLTALKIQADEFAKNNAKYKGTFLNQLSRPFNIFSASISETVSYVSRLLLYLKDMLAPAEAVASETFDMEQPLVRGNAERVAKALESLDDRIQVEGNSREFSIPRDEELRLVCEHILASSELDLSSLGWVFAKLVVAVFDAHGLSEIQKLLKTTPVTNYDNFRTIHEKVTALEGDFEKFIGFFGSFQGHIEWSLNRHRDLAQQVASSAAVSFHFIEKLANLREDGAIPTGVIGLPFGEMEAGAPAYSRLARATKYLPHWKNSAYLPYNRFLKDFDQIADSTILHIDSGWSTTREATSEARRRYWLPIQFAHANILLNFTAENQRFFDLCVIDIDTSEIENFADIYQEIEPMMKVGARVIVFSLATKERVFLPDDPRLIIGMFPPSGKARVVYTASNMARLSRKILDIGNRPRGTRWRAIRWSVKSASIAISAPFAVAAYLYERFRFRARGDRVAPRVPISITIEVSVI